MAALSGDLSIQGTASGPAAPLHSPTELARRLMDIGALATNCSGQIQSSETVAHGGTLHSIARTVRRLEAAREAANLLEHPLHVLACTQARTAVALEDDADPRDWKFLSGMRAQGNAHVYCGGLDAAIARALVFGRYAEVVCFRSPSTDLAEAARFAAEVHSSYPGKRLGFGHMPALDGVRWNELDHRAFDAMLRRIGYDFYFVTQFGQTAFPQAPVAGPWVLIDDAVRSEPADPELLPSLLAHRRRILLGHPHSAVCRPTFSRTGQRAASAGNL